MNIWIYIFGISCFLIFFNYAGYALLVVFLNKFKKKEKPGAPWAKDSFPSVSFIVAALNEADCIQQKITNSLEQDYPKEHVEFIFIADGSTDDTTAIILQNTSIQLLYSPERKGKSSAINRAVLSAKHDILIFSDANTLLNKEAIRNITRHYSNPLVGGVAGEKKIAMSAENPDKVGDGEGLYWKYESLLKKIDSQFYSVVGAAGELFSVRKELYDPIPEHVILDDFITSLKVAQKGYRVIYEPEAFAIELPSFSMEDERKRKIRIAAGGFQAMWILRSLLYFWKHPKLSFLYISHRVLRWAVTPVCLILAFISNAVLAFSKGNDTIKILFTAQVVFYAMAFVSSFISSRNKQLKILKLAYYFVFMNISVIHGFFRNLRGKQSASWEKVNRSQPTLNS